MDGLAERRGEVQSTKQQKGHSLGLEPSLGGYLLCQVLTPWFLVWGGLEAAGMDEGKPTGLGQQFLLTRREALYYVNTEATTWTSVWPWYLPWFLGDPDIEVSQWPFLGPSVVGVGWGGFGLRSLERDQGEMAAEPQSWWEVRWVGSHRQVLVCQPEAGSVPQQPAVPGKLVDAFSDRPKPSRSPQMPASQDD